MLPGVTSSAEGAASEDTLTGVDKAPAPAPPLAVTVIEYETPGCRPDTAHDVDADEHASEPFKNTE